MAERDEESGASCITVYVFVVYGLQSRLEVKEKKKEDLA